MTRISCIHQTAITTSADEGPYSNIQGWINQIDRAANGDEIGVICDDAAYDYTSEHAINRATNGTDAIRLTANDGSLVTTIDGGAAPNVRGDGSFRSGARIDGSHGDELIDLRSDFVVIDHIGFIQRSTSSTRDDGIRVRYARANVAIINCTFESTSTNADQDGIHIGTYNPSEYENLLIAGCSFLNWPRSAINRWQNSSAIKVGDNLVIVACGAYSSTANDPFSAFIHVGQDSTADTDDIHIFNNAGGYHEVASSRVASYTDSDTNTPAATPEGASLTWEGSHNFDDGFGLGEIDGTDTTTDWINGSADPSTADTTKTTGTFWVVEDLSAGTATFVPLDDAAGNAIIGAGLARASLPSAGTFCDAWWDTVNGTQEFDKRGYRFHATAPDIGPFSLEDHSTAADIPFTAQAASI